MIVKSLWTTLASTGAVSVALAATLSFNGVLTGADSSEFAAASNGGAGGTASLAGGPAASVSAESDSLAAGVSLAEAADVRVVVIDAGHGGRDLGCKGTTHGAREKTIALELAVALRDRIVERHPDIQVLLTRERDVFVPLHERARIANRAQADLFLSLHCNALPSAPKARGSESYVMGLHTAQHNLDVAKRENAAIHLEGDGDHDHYDFDPDSPAGHITLSMFQHAFLEQSMTLASNIETALGAREGRRSRGVKQAGFLVLKETAMPSVLVETGYLTNPSEEAYLKGEAGQATTVEALYRGVESYMKQRSREGREAQTVLASNRQYTAPSPSYSSPPTHAHLPAENAAAAEAEERLLHISEPDRKLEAHVAEAAITPSATLPAAAPAVLAKAQNEATAADVTEFYVQLSASTKALDLSRGKWTKLGHPIRTVREGAYNKYQAGPFATVREASAAKREVRNSGGFPDAFTIGYRGGVKLTRAELQGLE